MLHIYHKYLTTFSTDEMTPDDGIHYIFLGFGVQGRKITMSRNSPLNNL